jgi:hypothetical protein
MQAWDKVKDQLSSSTREHPLFGAVVLGESEELRILSASIIARAAVTKGELATFWPKRDYNAINISKFPLDVSSASWHEKLNSFAADTLLQVGNAQGYKPSPHQRVAGPLTAYLDALQSSTPKCSYWMQCGSKI